MKRIIIVEDDTVTGRLYQKHLQKADFTVEIAVDGTQGLKQITDSPPDGVLLDLMIPGINGIDVLKKLRALPGLQNLPIFVYTNAFIPAMRDQAKKAGATDVFDKSTMTSTMLVEAFRGATGIKA
jgi:CheY-like chemotaxis protein